MTMAPGRIQPMWVILLEALAALLLLIGLVWWTMFSGRKGGERTAAQADALPPSSGSGSGSAPAEQRPSAPGAGTEPRA